MDEGKLQERNHRNGLTRRRFSAGLCLGAVAALSTALSGCYGNGDGFPIGTVDPQTPATPASPPPAASAATGQAWKVADAGALALQPGASFDLAATLPPGVARGGAFAVDPSGAPLPAGVTLLTSGLLTVAGSAAGTTNGVVFRYTPPA